MEQKLQTYGRVRGLAIGAWGEISEDFKMLLQVMADKKQEELQAQTGGEFRKSVTIAARQGWRIRRTGDFKL